MQYIAFDAHKDYTLASVERPDGRIVCEERVPLNGTPGVGSILAVVIALEVGDVARFASSEKFAAYAGTTPRVHASGGRTRFGPLRPDVNRYLKWAFVEAATVICRHRRRHPKRHVSQLYERIARRKRWPAIWPRRPIGCSPNESPIENPDVPKPGLAGPGSSTEASARVATELTEARFMIATRLRDILMPLRRRRDDSDETG